MFGGMVQKSRVFIGVPLLMDQGEDLYAVIRRECRAHGLLACRSYGLPGYPEITSDVVRLILDSDLCIFDLTHGSPTVCAELACAQRCGTAPDWILLLAQPGADLPEGVAPGDVWFYRTIDDLRNLVRAAVEWKIEQPTQRPGAYDPGDVLIERESRINVEDDLPCGRPQSGASPCGQ